MINWFVKSIAVILFFVYLAFVYGLTFLPIEWYYISKPVELNPLAFLNHPTIYDGVQVGGNLFLLLPFPIFLATLFKSLRNFWGAVSLTFVLSFFIESTQYVLYHLHIDARVADASDIFLNTLGGVIGYLIFRTLVNPILNLLKN